MNYHHLIWDFDGTLFNTYPALNRAIRLAAADLGAMVQPDRVARLLAQTLALCVETLAMDNGLDGEVFNQRIAHYRAQIGPEEKPPIPGAMDMCQRVIDAGGQNYIFTHRDHASMGELLDWYKVRGLFVATASVEDGYPRKPNAAGFLALIEQFGLDIGDVLAVGDRTLDLLAARKAQIAACLFARETDQLVTPQHHIRDMSELAAVLGLA